MADSVKNTKLTSVVRESSIVWCQETMPPWVPLSFALGLCTPSLYFPTSTFFIRWLFEPQKITSRRSLVVGWREAKPCARAISAARTGDTQSLRPDEKRPAPQPLQTELGDCLCAEVDKGIQTLILVVDGPRQESRALNWASTVHPGLDVHVASTPGALVSLLRASGAPLGSACGPPPGLKRKHGPDDERAPAQEAAIPRSDQVMHATPVSSRFMSTVPSRLPHFAGIAAR